MRLSAPYGLLPYTTLTNLFCRSEAECLLRGTPWALIWNRHVSSLKG